MIYDVDLENTLPNIKKQKWFFNVKARDNGDIIRNGFPVEKIGGNKLKINDKIYKISDDLQNVFTDTSNVPLKKLNDKDREIYKNISESLDFENYKAIRGETKSARYKYSKNKLGRSRSENYYTI